MGVETQPIKTNFTAGELSPRLMGRVDISKYFNGAQKVENFMVMAHGGIIARPGSRHVQPVKDSSAKTKLLTFEFSEDESYTLEFGDQYIRFYSDDGAVVESSKTIIDITQASLGVIQTSGAHGYTAGDNIYISGVVGMTEINSYYEINTTPAADTFTLKDIYGVALNTSGFTAYVSDGISEKVYQISSPFLTADLFELQTAQSADVMYIVHRNYAPRKLARTGHTNWTLSTPTFNVGSGNIGGAFNSAGEFPGAVAFFQQRLVFGGSDDQTQTLFFSVAGSFEDFDGDAAAADDAMVYTISTDKVNSIRWLSAGKTLACGTIGGEFSVSPSGDNEAITPTNININRETSYGSAAIQPVRVSNAVLFVQRARRKVRQFQFSFEADGFLSDDITILSEHILRGGITDMAYQAEENSVLWFVRSDGQLISLTYQKDQQVFGWSRHILGGSFGAGDAVVESINVVPDTNQDQVWLIVKRTINGETMRYVEYLTEPFYGETQAEKEAAVQVDSSLSYSGTDVTVISGLEHLEGETVSILADGNVKPDTAVSAGTITLPVAAGEVAVGLSYTPTVRTVNFEQGNPRGTAQGKLARIHRIVLRFFQTIGGFIGHGDDDDLYEEVEFDEIVVGQSPDLFTGDKPALFQKGHTTEPYVEYQQRQPLPCTILSIMPEYKVNE